MTSSRIETVKTGDAQTGATLLRSYKGEQKGTGDWLATATSLLVGAGFFALWFWLLPSWLGFRVEAARTARWRWMAAVPSILVLR